MSTNLAHRPVDGLRVVEISQLSAAPLGGLTLCDLGADVVKLEGPHGDYTRTGALEGSETAIFPILNRGNIEQRKQFGWAIGSFQTIKHRFAKSATELECDRLPIYAVSRQVDAEPTTALPCEASMARLKVTETARRVTLECVQMMDECGLAREFEVEPAVRQAIGATSYGATNEIQGDIIAKAYGL
jgi:hypothetical protein